MNIRRLIVPLGLAFAMQATLAHAQGAFPAPLPSGAAAPANASPFPPVNGAAPSPFPSAGAAPMEIGRAHV